MSNEVKIKSADDSSNVLKSKDKFLLDNTEKANLNLIINNKNKGEKRIFHWINLFPIIPNVIFGIGFCLNKLLFGIEDNKMTVSLLVYSITILISLVILCVIHLVNKRGNKNYFKFINILVFFKFIFSFIFLSVSSLFLLFSTLEVEFYDKENYNDVKIIYKVIYYSIFILGSIVSLIHDFINIFAIKKSIRNALNEAEIKFNYFYINEIFEGLFYCCFVVGFILYWESFEFKNKGIFALGIIVVICAISVINVIMMMSNFCCLRGCFIYLNIVKIVLLFLLSGYLIYLLKFFVYECEVKIYGHYGNLLMLIGMSVSVLSCFLCLCENIKERKRILEEDKNKAQK